MAPLRHRILAGLLIAGLVACGPTEPGDYLRVGGGGFVFNYRIAEGTAGIIAEPARSLPDGATIEVAFEDPAGRPAVVIAKPVSQGRKRYSFSTPVEGVVADRPYAITVRLIAADGTVLQTIDHEIRSDVDQSVLPDKPLTVGPGHHRNPGTAADPGGAD